MQRQLVVCIAGIAADRAVYQFDLRVAQIDIIAVVKICQVQIIQLGDALSTSTDVMESLSPYQDA